MTVRRGSAAKFSQIVTFLRTSCKNESSGSECASARTIARAQSHVARAHKERGTRRAAASLQLARISICINSRVVLCNGSCGLGGPALLVRRRLVATVATRVVARFNGRLLRLGETFSQSLRARARSLRAGCVVNFTLAR